jgi:hypothetical protein
LVEIDEHEQIELELEDVLNTLDRSITYIHIGGVGGDWVTLAIVESIASSMRGFSRLFRFCHILYRTAISIDQVDMAAI